jgi:hypothetical protein
MEDRAKKLKPAQSDNDAAVEKPKRYGHAIFGRGKKLRPRLDQMLKQRVDAQIFLEKSAAFPGNWRTRPPDCSGIIPAPRPAPTLSSPLTSRYQKDSQAGDEDTRHAGEAHRFAEQEPGQDGGEDIAQADQGVGVADFRLGQHDEPDHKPQAVTEEPEEHGETSGRFHEDRRQG